MSEQQLRQILEIASDVCARQFAKNGVIYPMWHVVPANGDHMFVRPPSPDKDTSAALMRALFDIRDVVRYVFIDEGWMLDKSAGISDADLARIKLEGLSKRPDRVEVVMFMGEDRDCGHMLARRLIHRPAKGKPYLGPLDYTMLPGLGGAAEGRLVGMLPVRGMRQ